MRVAKIEAETYVDGPGKRVALFVQGCSIGCPGCQNRHLWDQESGEDESPLVLAGLLHESGLPVTVTGGEPFDQPGELRTLLEHLRRMSLWTHVVVYTGHVFEDLVRTGDLDVLRALTMVDVLVDGPYVRELDASGMQYRGSSNQRVIDVQATLARSARVILSEGPVTLDWDTPELVLTEAGDLLAATPLAMAYAEVGEPEATRRCGELRT